VLLSRYADISGREYVRKRGFVEDFLHMIYDHGSFLAETM